MKIDNIIPSTLKIVASENLNIQKDLIEQDPEKTLSEILNEKEEKEKTPKS
jgi:hypothetical protein